MPKYIINICYGDLEKRGQSKHPDNSDFIMNKYREWSQKMGQKIVVAHKLSDQGGYKLDLVDGEVKDGPYTETKESLGGFYIVDVPSYEEAKKLASECPTLLYQGGYLEVREVEI
jgi:hypothetical protein